MVSAVMADVAMEELGLELAVFRNLGDDKTRGAFSSNFAGQKGKRCIIVDDVLGTGDTLKGAIENLKKEGAKPVLCMVIVNKTGEDRVGGVKLRALVRSVVVE